MAYTSLIIVIVVSNIACEIFRKLCSKPVRNIKKIVRAFMVPYYVNILGVSGCAPANYHDACIQR